MLKGLFQFEQISNSRNRKLTDAIKIGQGRSRTIGTQTLVFHCGDGYAHVAALPCISSASIR